MIIIKSDKEIEFMRRAGKLAAKVRQLAGSMVRPGITTAEIDRAVHDYILSRGGTPSFLNYNGYPASVCISINEEVIHGIPGKRRIKEGDIVSLDLGAEVDGFHGDCAATFIAGKADPEAERLIRVTEESFYEGLKFARMGCRVSDISNAVQRHAEANGFSVVRQFVGHGIGSKLHEEPEVPNFGSPGRGPRLVRGMTIAIEPMVNQGVYDIHILKDKWTVVTADGKLSAHYENTVLITEGEPEILTVTD